MADHRQIFPWGGITFWKEGASATPDDATKATFEIGHGLRTVRLDFAWPTESQKVEALKSGLALAMTSGDWQARKEVRSALGIHEHF